MELRSPEPEVRLVQSFQRPLDGAVAAARTCYSSSGIVSAEQVAGDEFEDPSEREQALHRRDALASEIYAAGHHTVFQHAHFEFAIDRISRHALWAFFHAHPFYNSEQVSQRYVKVRRGHCLVPELPADQLEIYNQLLDLQQRAYAELTEKLFPVAESVFFRLFPARSRHPEQWRREIRRKAQEAARYVLPVATWARLYHTISAVTLLRYRRMAAQLDLPGEVRSVVEQMVGEVLRLDPALEPVFESALDPGGLPEATIYNENRGILDSARAAEFREEFDASLDGRVSRLVGWSAGAEGIVAQAVREVLGMPRSRLDDGRALDLASDPASNPLFGEALNVTTLARLTRALHHAQYTFRRKLSHTADSQDQRHRMTPASRPILLAHLGDEPDVIMPRLIASDAACRRSFDETMARTWDGIRRLRRMACPPEVLAYLLPNAVAVRFTCSADYIALRHKHAMRLCYNAQEEIWNASRDEALQIRDVHPRLGARLLPPCSIRLRAGRRPVCPEGRRFCGVSVWKLDPADYDRLL